MHLFFENVLKFIFVSEDGVGFFVEILQLRNTKYKQTVSLGQHYNMYQNSVMCQIFTLPSVLDR